MVGSGGRKRGGGGVPTFGFSHTQHSTWSVWLSDLGLTSGQVHPPEAITTKFDFLLCEYLFIMNMLLWVGSSEAGWAGGGGGVSESGGKWETDGQTEPINS